MAALSPFVFWAQNEKCIFLKIDLKDVKDPQINLGSNKLEFKSKGVGARGLNSYAFSLDFNNDIDAKESVHKILDSRVEFTISKKETNWWPRLTSQSTKPAWLKIDHDKFQSEDLDEEPEENSADIQKNYPDLYEKLQKEEIGYIKENMKKVYLSIYNIFMFVAFFYVWSILVINYLKDGMDSFQETYSKVGSVMCFIEMLQMLEAMHPIFGYVPGSFLVPLLQVGGRNFILYFMLQSEPRVQKMPVVFYLFLVWSSIEIVRYPYYLMQQFKRKNALLTWLRYSAWIILFPAGFICEAVIIFRNLLFLEQTEKWTVTLPSPLDYTLKFSTLLRVYLLFFIFPTFYILMSHMHKLRKKKLPAIKPSKKAKSKKE